MRFAFIHEMRMACLPYWRSISRCHGSAVRPIPAPRLSAICWCHVFGPCVPGGYRWGIMARELLGRTLKHPLPGTARAWHGLPGATIVGMCGRPRSCATRRGDSGSGSRFPGCHDRNPHARRSSPGFMHYWNAGSTSSITRASCSRWFHEVMRRVTPSKPRPSYIFSRSITSAAVP